MQSEIHRAISLNFVRLDIARNRIDSNDELHWQVYARCSRTWPWVVVISTQ